MAVSPVLAFWLLLKSARLFPCFSPRVCFLRQSIYLSILGHAFLYRSIYLSIPPSRAARVVVCGSCSARVPFRLSSVVFAVPSAGYVDAR